MKTINPVIDTIVESQSQFMNNWMNSAGKSAFANVTSQRRPVAVQEYFDKQMGVFNNMRKRLRMFGSNAETNHRSFSKTGLTSGFLRQTNGRLWNQSIQDNGYQLW